MRLNILMITRLYWPHLGGNENQAKLLAEHLKKNHPVEITIITSLYDKKLKQFETYKNINIVRLPHFLLRKKSTNKKSIPIRLIDKIKFLLQEYSYQIELFNFLIKEISRFDIIHVHQTSWLSILPSFIGRKYYKQVIIKEATLNGFQFLRTLFLPSKLKQIPIKYSNFIGVSSMIIENLLQQGVPRSKIFLIPNGVKLPSSLPKIKPHSNSLKKILFVGNFSHGKIKGFDILLLAISIVQKSFPDFILQVIGNGDPHEYDNIITQNTLRENIKFLGEQTDVAKYYQSANVFVLPSRSEGMSNSLLEAMSYGVPCVATKVSGVEDIIDNSINGFIVDVEDFQDMAEKILEVLTKPDLEEKFKKMSREKIEKNFSIEAIAKQYYGVYSKLVSNESQ